MVRVERITALEYLEESAHGQFFVFDQRRAFFFVQPALCYHFLHVTNYNVFERNSKRIDI